MMLIMNKLIGLYFAIQFQIANIVKRVRLRSFMREHPDYVYMFSKEADERIKDYLETTDIRLKRIAATMLMKNYICAFRLSLEQNLSMVELNYISSIIPEIKNELKLL